MYLDARLGLELGVFNKRLICNVHKNTEIYRFHKIV